MKLAEHSRWFNRDGIAPLLALSLLAICLKPTRRAAHSPNLPGSNLVGNSHQLRQTVTIQFLDSPAWVTGLYFYCLIVVLIYLAERRLPVWVTGCTFALLAAPRLMGLIRAALFAAKRIE